MLDFANVNLKVIDIHLSGTADMFVNQNNITFSKRVLEDLGYPAYVQYCIDAEHAVFAIRVCKGSESRAVPFVKERNEQSKSLSCTNRSLRDVVTRFIPEYQPKKRYKLAGHYDSENKVMYFDLSEAVISMYFKEEEA